jgi:preprotein translocase subunit YajC
MRNNAKKPRFLTRFCHHFALNFQFSTHPTLSFSLVAPWQMALPSQTIRQLRLPSAFNALNCPFIFIMHWNVLFADTAAPASAGSTGSATPGAAPSPTQQLFTSPLVFIVLIGVMMYFMIFRPQQQRAKQQARLLAGIKSGDKVVTSSGIVGTIITVKEKTVSLRSADAKMEVTKSSITEILETSDDTQTSP